MRITRLIALLVPLLLISACSARSYRVATVSVASAHESLSIAQDTALLLKCGEPTAPSAPLCISDVAPAEGEDSPNVRIHKLLSKGFELSGAVAKAVRDWPADKPMPVEIPQYLAQITDILSDVVHALPDGAAKSKLVAILGTSKKE